MLCAFVRMCACEFECVCVCLSVCGLVGVWGSMLRCSTVLEGLVQTTSELSFAGHI